jgi:transcriptional regulator with XRE-family HTH domain
VTTACSWPSRPAGLESRTHYFGDVERGERNVSLANILKIARALDVPASAVHARAEQLLRRVGRRSKRP